MKLLYAFAAVCSLVNSLQLETMGVDSRLSSRIKDRDTVSVECPFVYNRRGKTRNSGADIEIWGNQFVADDGTGTLVTQPTTFWMDFENMKKETNTIVGTLSVATIRGYSCNRATEGTVLHTF